MGHSCGCGHCACDDNNLPAGEEKTPEEKIKDLEKAIEDLGYKVEETPEGDIKISE